MGQIKNEEYSRCQSNYIINFPLKLKDTWIYNSEKILVTKNICKCSTMLLWKYGRVIFSCAVGKNKNWYNHFGKFWKFFLL